MSFTYNGTDTITQTGTDTDLSGLQALTSVVDFVVKGNRTIYNLKAILAVEGTLSVEPREEALEFTDEATIWPKFSTKDGSNLTVGTKTTSGSESIYSIGTWLLITHKAEHGWTWNEIGVYFERFSNVTLYGGTIDCSAPVTLGTTPNCEAQDIVLQVTLNQDARLMTHYGTISNATVYNNGINIVGTANLGSNLTLINASPIGVHGAATNLFSVASGGFILDNYDYVISGQLFPWGDAYWTAKNCPRGGTISTAWGSGGTDYQCLIKSTQDVQFTIKDLQGLAIEGVKVRTNDYVNGETETVQGFDLSTQNVYEGSTDSSGVVLIENIVQRNYWKKKINSVYTADMYNYRTKANDGSDMFDFTGCSYLYTILNSPDYLVRSRGVQEDSITMLPDTSITETDTTLVQAYTELDTSVKLYDYAKLYLYTNYAGELSTIVSRSGDLIDLGSHNLVIDASASSVFTYDGTTITIKANVYTGNLITTGTITIASGTTYYGTRTDTNGTIAPLVPITASNLLAGTRVYVLDVTNDIVLYNDVLATDGFYLDYQYTGVDIDVKFKATKIGYHYIVSETIIPSFGVSFPYIQEVDTVYNANAIDGSTVTEFAVDLITGNVDIKANDDDNYTTIQRAYNWFKYVLTTPIGIQNFGDVFKASDVYNYSIDNATTIRNLKTEPLVVGGGVLERTDGLSVIATDSNSVQISPVRVYGTTVYLEDPYTVTDIANAVWSKEMV